MELPTSLNYTASKSVIKYKRFNVRTLGTNSGGAGSVVRMRLPNGLINLSSFALCFDLTVSGLVVDGVAPFIDYFNVKMPHGHKLLREVKCFVNNQQVSGKCGDYDILYNALVKASVGEDWVNSRMNEHAKELIDSADDFGILKQNPTETSKVASYIVSDLLGLFRSGDKSIIDTSLWGQVELEFTFNNTSAIAQYVAGNATNANLQMRFTNVEGFVEKVTAITPVYNQLVNMMLNNRKEPLIYCYQNMVSTINSNGSSARLQCRSQSIDAVLCCPLDPNYNALLSVINPDTQLSAPRYRYNSGRTISPTNALSTKNCNLQISINGDCYPDVPVNNCLHISHITTSGLFNHSVYSQNLLFNDISASRYGMSGTFQPYDFAGNDFVDILAASAPSYNRSAFLNENFVWYQSLCNGEGYINKVLTGYDTESQSAEIIVNHDCIVDGGSLFVAALTTSCLSLDPVSKQMTVIE
jgi:hypothetical protein